MTGLITLREPVVTTPDTEPPLPVVDEDGKPIEWTHRQAAGLRFERWRAQRGDFDGDRFPLAREPVPAIDPEDLGRNDR